MAARSRTERVDVRSLRKHLSEALEDAENESTRYHLREAYQKVLVFENEWE